MSTRKDFEAIIQLHYTRYRVVESLGGLIIYLPSIPNRSFISAINYLKAVQVSIYFWKLSWWRCWFRSYWVSEFERNNLEAKDVSKN